MPPPAEKPLPTEPDLSAVAFPRLDEFQMVALEQCPLTRRRTYRNGEKLFESGEPDPRFYVIRSGEVEIVDESAETPRTIAVQGRGEFIGEVAQLTGRRALVTAVAKGACEVYEMTSEALRQLLNRHPNVGDIIIQAFIARRQLLDRPDTAAGPRVIGSRYSAEAFGVREFLAKNRVPYLWVDTEGNPEAGKLLQKLGVSEAETPVVAWARKVVLRKPSNRELARAIGLRRPLDNASFDLVVVGAGPAGLAAAVYGASEGLETLVLERSAPGGQAGRSMRIENYLGFAIGVTGIDFAERAVVQAAKFGACLPVATEVLSLSFEHGMSLLHIDGDETVRAKCLLIASGAEYRRLDANGCERFEGRGVYYAATVTEAQMCRGSDVVVVGGGNSAGQAAVFLASQVRKVYLAIRGDDLLKNMSSYLADRIEQTPNIEVLRNSEVKEISGGDFIGECSVVNNKTGERRTIKSAALFSFIGAVPRTDWLPDEIELDEKGFVRTGPLGSTCDPGGGQQPFLLETSHPGVFAAGDVRSGSVKRVASAAGEGAMAVQFVHQRLQQMGRPGGSGAAEPSQSSSEDLSKRERSDDNGSHGRGS